MAVAKENAFSYLMTKMLTFWGKTDDWDDFRC